MNRQAFRERGIGACFMAGLATHPSADPDARVVRHGLEERERLIEDVCRVSNRTLCATCFPCRGA
jgi:hypothetical protein